MTIQVSESERFTQLQVLTLTADLCPKQRVNGPNEPTCRT